MKAENEEFGLFISVNYSKEHDILGEMQKTSARVTMTRDIEGSLFMINLLLLLRTAAEKGD